MPTNATSSPPAPTSLSPLHARGKDIVDERGNVVVLTGFGLGGWLVPEGYMLGMPGGKDGPRSIRAAIEAKIGSEKTNEFFARYERNYVTEADIVAIAKWGFNSVRLPLNANALMPETGQPKTAPFVYREAGFRPIDELVKWCRAAGLYVILDLHAAPGAQSAHNIADSDGEARLWSERETYWPRTVDLWLTLAARYRNEPHVIGYDLLNEPMVPGAEIGRTSQTNGPWSSHDNRPLRELYVEITHALRAAGDRKIVFPEAGFWAMNFKDLLPPWDDNLVYSFHFYPPPTGQKFFESADATPSFSPIFDADVPLWMGETGEWRQDWIKTRTDWLADNRKMVEFMRHANRGHSISWSWWTTKKFERETQPWVCHFPTEYSALLANWDNASSHDAEVALLKFADALATDACTHHPDLVEALGGTP